MRWLAWIAPVLLSSSSPDCFLRAICKTSHRWSSIILFVLSSCSSLSTLGWFIDTVHYPWLCLITQCCNYSLLLIFNWAFKHHIFKKFVENCVSLFFLLLLRNWGILFYILIREHYLLLWFRYTIVQNFEVCILKKKCSLMFTKAACILLKIHLKM